ncbi:MAG: alkaline phosphatase family protein [Leucobacter sp.]
MLPSASDNGARLAAILPSGILSLAQGLRGEVNETLRQLLMPQGSEENHLSASPEMPSSLPGIRSLVLIVIDGLGHSNLKARSGHARSLAALPTRRIETVIPSTTGAALTSLTTGRLPGAHGLVGYRIRHPELGLINTLQDWDGIEDTRTWQRCAPLFPIAHELGVRTFAIGRPAHATGGLTEAILSGAEYIGGQRIEDRFAAASRVLRGSDPVLTYLYVDELDRAAHEHGWQSDAWLRRLEQVDSSLEAFMRTLPSNVGVVVTADHGIVDVMSHQQVMLDQQPELLNGVTAIGGEPRMRSLFLDHDADVERLVALWGAAESARAWVGTREEAIAANWFGPVDASVAPRIGDVIIAAKRQVAYYLSGDDPRALAMVGQHGSLSSEERGVPLALGGVLDGSGFASAVTQIAEARAPREVS